MEHKHLQGITFLLICIVVIWAVSSWKLMKHTELKGKAKYIYALSAFPLLIILSALTIILGARFAPELVNGLTEISNSNIPTMLQGLVVVPIFGAIPLIGFLLWWKLIKFIGGVSSNEKTR